MGGGEVGMSWLVKSKCDLCFFFFFSYLFISVLANTYYRYQKKYRISLSGPISIDKYTSLTTDLLWSCQSAHLTEMSCYSCATLCTVHYFAGGAVGGNGRWGGWDVLILYLYWKKYVIGAFFVISIHIGIGKYYSVSDQLISIDKYTSLTTDLLWSCQSAHLTVKCFVLYILFSGIRSFHTQVWLFFGKINHFLSKAVCSFCTFSQV